MQSTRCAWDEPVVREVFDFQTHSRRATALRALGFGKISKGKPPVIYDRFGNPVLVDNRDGCPYLVKVEVKDRPHRIRRLSRTFAKISHAKVESDNQ